MKDFEIEILKSLRSISNDSLDMIFRCISFLGEKFFLVFVVTAIYFLYDKKVGQRILYSVMATACLNNTLKGLIKYDRPFVYSSEYSPAENAIDGATGYSFPSGHTQNAANLYTSVALNFKKKNITIACIIIIILIGFSRMYLGVHYPKDVLVGAILGVGISFLSYYLHKKYEDNFKNLMRLYLITLLIFVPFIFIFWSSDYTKLLPLRDFYISFSFSCGAICAIYIENKFLNFKKSESLKINILRMIGCLVFFLGTYLGLKLLFNLPFLKNDSNSLKIIFDSIRYFLTLFIPLGIYPLIFKNSLFK